MAPSLHVSEVDAASAGHHLGYKEAMTKGRMAREALASVRRRECWEGESVVKGRRRPGLEYLRAAEPHAGPVQAA